jgi:monofunctional biosynthetic peptidoglycan transglycosylase
MWVRRTLFILIAVILGLTWFLSISAYFGTPPVIQLNWMNPAKTSYMRADRYNKIECEWRPIIKISKHLQNAVVLAEDDQFFNHRGYDWKALKLAYHVNMKRGKFSRGASTITMQVARNLYLYPRKSLLRKAQEILIALKLELLLSKERILEIYLNSAEWGNGIYGAEAAARHYYGKSAQLLSKEEGAWLAAILPRPKFYDRNRNAEMPHKRAADIAGRL